MIFENVELHNVVEIEEQRGVPGVMLRRIPRKIREQLGTRGRFVSAWASGCEVRFVTESPVIRISLFSEVAADVTVNCGDFQHSRHKLAAGAVTTLQLDYPQSFNNVRKDALHRSFSPKVWRFGFDRDTSFVGVEAYGFDVRPPNPDEKPAKRWLAYGSSITNSNFETGYPHVAARMLGVDVYNVGLSGACRMEGAMVDFLASRADFDFVTAELGVNVRGEYSVEEFRTRAAYLIDRFLSANPDMPLAIITHFQTGQSHPLNETPVVAAQRAFDQVLRDLVDARRRPNLHLIEGASILDRFDLLSIDLVHPTSVGQVRMGMNLASRLLEIIQ